MKIIKDTMREFKTKKKTIGEELFLIHLKQESSKEENEKSLDEALPRKRSRSIGDELYEIHLKRSQGLPPDYDIKKDEDVVNILPLDETLILNKKDSFKRGLVSSSKTMESIAIRINGNKDEEEKNKA